MKYVKWFKNKTQMYTYILMFLILLGCFVYVGTLKQDNSEITDSEKFVLEHEEVSKDNVFVYVDANKAYNLIKNDNVIMLFGTSNDKWVTYYANILNDIAKEKGITKIYYYDIADDRENQNATYQAIVEILKDYATMLDDENKNLYTPSLVIKKDGIITYFDDETAITKGSMTPEIYWSNYEINLKKQILNAAFDSYLKGDN